MEFKDFNIKLQKHVENMTKDVNTLFCTEVDKDELWNLYLDSFAPEKNKIFRERREYDCSCCKSFIRNFGNVVSIKDNKITTIWDFELDDDTFGPVIVKLSEYVKSKPIENVFIRDTLKFGTPESIEEIEGKIITWDHFNVTLPSKFNTIKNKDLGSKLGEIKTNKLVYTRSLNEISMDSLDTVLELISQKSLYKGEEWKNVLIEFKKYKTNYEQATNKELYIWESLLPAGAGLSRLKNHSIGTLLMDISNNEDLDISVKKYETIVAPSNYKRPKAIFTAKMVEQAQKTMEELGYLPALERRYAMIDDISINNVLFANRDIKKSLKENVFDDLKSESNTPTKTFQKVEEINIDTFINDILPQAKNIELFLENKHNRNLVSLIGPKNDCKSMFKWNNNFTWAYSGNITDSMKEKVKAAGGKVDGVLRFSIQWNDTEYDRNDLDAHCMEPNGNLIYYGQKHSITGGRLDVDIQYPDRDVTAVENITWSNLKNMPDGKYEFYVHNYADRGGRTGFSAEIEFDNQIFSFEYRNRIKDKEKIKVAEVSKHEGKFTIKEVLTSSVSSKVIWNLPTNKFHPVQLCMYSPNYWDKQSGIGNKHYMFMLKDCINPENPNGFFNEFLNEELMKHKKVFEALGSKMKVEETNNQLSGLGFSSTQRNEVLCKIEGNFNRTIKIIF